MSLVSKPIIRQGRVRGLESYSNESVADHQKQAHVICRIGGTDREEIIGFVETIGNVAQRLGGHMDC